MGELREIVDIATMSKVFALLALVLPVMGVLVGAVWGMRQRQARRGAFYGLLVGLLGPLNWLLWHVYNAITDSAGLDTVRNVVYNLVLFVAVGLFIGLGIGYVLRRLAGASEETNQGTQISQPSETVAVQE